MAVMEITAKSWCSKPDRSCSDWSRTGIPSYRTTEMDCATTNGALQEAAPGRPELRYEPDQNGRKSGRGGLGRKMNTGRTGAAREKPPRIASGHFGEGGDIHGSPVPPALRRKIPEKEVKNTDFHSPPGCDLCREADPRVLPGCFPLFSKLCSVKPRTGYP